MTLVQRRRSYMIKIQKRNKFLAARTYGFSYIYKNI